MNIVKQGTRPTFFLSIGKNFWNREFVLMLYKACQSHGRICLFETEADIGDYWIKNG
jgi:hypothetical protein